MPLLSPAMQSKATARGKVITQLVSWDASDADGIVFDFTAQGNAMLLREPVCVFVDNTRGTGQITLSVEGYAYQLVIQPGMIASLPLFAVSLPRVTVTAADGTSGLTSIVFCDFMLPNFAFDATAVSQSTTDTILQEVVSGGAGSESLRVTDAGAISSLGAIATLISDGNKNIASILEGISGTVDVSDAEVLAQLKTTLAVSDAEVLAQLKTTLAVADKNVSTAAVYTLSANSGVGMITGAAVITAITVIPTVAHSDITIFNILDNPTNVSAPVSSLVACLPATAVNVPFRQMYPEPLRVSNGLSIIAATGPWNGSDYVNADAVIIVETLTVES